MVARRHCYRDSWRNPERGGMLVVVPKPRTVVAVITAFVAAPVVGEWFIESAKEQGAYEAPSSRVAAAVDWTASIAAAPGYQFALGLAVGLTIGLWADRLLRKRERRRAGAGAPEPGPEPKERIYIPESMTVADLTGPFQDHAEVDAEQIAMRFVGKWMKVQGIVRESPPARTAAFTSLSRRLCSRQA